MGALCWCCRWRGAGERIDQRAKEKLRGHHRGCGIAGKAEGERGGVRGEPGGLAGLDGDLLENGREAFCRKSGSDDVIVADGSATDGDDDIARRGQALADVFCVSRERPRSTGIAPQRRMMASRAGWIELTTSPRRQLVSRGHEFIAVGEHADARGFRDDDLCHIAGCRERDRTFAHHPAGGDQRGAACEVEACAADVFGAGLFEGDGDVVAFALRVFPGSGCGPRLRDVGAGEDVDGFAGGEASGERDASAGSGGDFQRCTEPGVGMKDGVPVHGGDVCRGLGDLRHNGFCWGLRPSAAARETVSRPSAAERHGSRSGRAPVRRWPGGSSVFLFVVLRAE